jgi:hypothetical protein
MLLPGARNAYEGHPGASSFKGDSVKLRWVLTIVGTVVCCGRVWGTEADCQRYLAVAQEENRDATAYAKTGDSAAACMQLEAALHELVKAQDVCKSDPASITDLVTRQMIALAPCRHKCGEVGRLKGILSEADLALYKSVCGAKKTASRKKTPSGGGNTITCADIRAALASGKSADDVCKEFHISRRTVGICEHH